MRTGTGLTLLAIDAILAFAVTTNTSVFKTTSAMAGPGPAASPAHGLWRGSERARAPARPPRVNAANPYPKGI